MTKEQYIESLRKLNLKVYFMGELISNPVDHPMIRPSMNSVAMTYELAERWVQDAHDGKIQSYRKNS